MPGTAGHFEYPRIPQQPPGESAVPVNVSVKRTPRQRGDAACPQSLVHCMLSSSVSSGCWTPRHGVLAAPEPHRSLECCSKHTAVPALSSTGTSPESFTFPKHPWYRCDHCAVAQGEAKASLSCGARPLCPRSSAAIASHQ